MARVSDQSVMEGCSGSSDERAEKREKNGRVFGYWLESNSFFEL